DAKRVTGGSSGGSAAAVAAGLVPVALGSDTAGSVRQPAAFCGVVGFKPSYGRISRYGLVAYASSLDTVGIFANAVRDAAQVFEVMAGVDAHDATSSDRDVAVTSFADDLNGVVVGVPREYFTRELNAAVKEKCGRAITRMQEAGAIIREVTLPHTRFAIPAYYALSTAEACSNLARYDGVRYGVRARDAATLAQLYDRTRTIGFGPEVKRRILLGLHVLSEEPRSTLTRARQAVTAIAGELDSVFAGGVDFLFTPTAPTPAFVAGEKTDPYELYLSDMFTVPANLSGIPALSIPIGQVDGMPVGGQLMARKWHDAELLSAGAVLERVVA
ncbi:MAG TPA: amidase family protein, partial [Longimicrobiales bacterium]